LLSSHGKITILALGCSYVVEHVDDICEALGFLPAPQHKEGKKVKEKLLSPYP
jgi:hypothetical protein